MYWQEDPEDGILKMGFTEAGWQEDNVTVLCPIAVAPDNALTMQLCVYVCMCVSMRERERDY